MEGWPGWVNLGTHKTTSWNLASTNAPEQCTEFIPSQTNFTDSDHVACHGICSSISRFHVRYNSFMYIKQLCILCVLPCYERRCHKVQRDSEIQEPLRRPSFSSTVNFLTSLSLSLFLLVHDCWASDNCESLSAMDVGRDDDRGECDCWTGTRHRQRSPLSCNNDNLRTTTSHVLIDTLVMVVVSVIAGLVLDTSSALRCLVTMTIYAPQHHVD